MENKSGSLLHGVIKVCSRLSGQGWDALLKHHGLDITSGNLETELLKPLASIDRTLPGFEDFALEAYRGIEPGNLSHSLLYHSLSSPRVLVCPKGHPLSAYPTLREIEAVENYVFGVHPPSVQDIRVRADDAPLAM